MKKQLFILLTLMALWTGASAQGHQSIILKRTEVAKRLTDAKYHPNYFQAMSHRGRMSGYPQFPENSLSAIRNVTHLGVSLVEIDVKLSSDGIPYLLHDLYLQRTTNFLDIVPGTGTGQDPYGKYNNYPWSLISQLVLKRADFTYTNEHVPSLRDVVRYVRDHTEAMIQLDIANDEIFEASWQVVKEENAFDVAMFKLKGTSVEDFRKKYYDKLTKKQQKQLILFIIIDGKKPDTKDYYLSWEKSKIAKGYEISFEDNKSKRDKTLLDIVDDVRKRNRTRVHAFNTIPDMYYGRYKGQLNVGQVANSKHDRRGDWVFLLDPLEKGNTSIGVNGSIITDDALLLNEFYQSIHRHE